VNSGKREDECGVSVRTEVVASRCQWSVVVGARIVVFKISLKLLFNGCRELTTDH
jgi:hypothetical protein